MVSQPGLSRRVDIYRFPIAVLILVPLLALIVQVSLPVYIHRSSMVNLPLLVVIYYSLAHRNPVSGLLAGALIGVAQDSLSRDPIGLFAITNTVIGFVTSFASSRIETESAPLRFVIVFVLCCIHLFGVYALSVSLFGAIRDFSPIETLLGSLVNAVIGVLLFVLLDRFRKHV